MDSQTHRSWTCELIRTLIHSYYGNLEHRDPLILSYLARTILTLWYSWTHDYMDSWTHDYVDLDSRGLLVFSLWHPELTRLFNMIWYEDIKLMSSGHEIENNPNYFQITNFDQNTQFQRKHFPLSYIRNFGIFGNGGSRRMEKTNQLNDISTFGYFAPPP